MPTDYLSLARDVLTHNIHAALATADNAGTPWNTPLFIAFDADLNFYWSSFPDSQHSRNIQANHQGFLVIFNPEQGGKGVYIQAKVAELATRGEITNALKLLSQRRDKEMILDKFLASPQRIYQAAPRKIWVNGAEKDRDGNYVKDYRQEIVLSDLKQILLLS